MPTQPLPDALFTCRAACDCVVLLFPVPDGALASPRALPTRTRPCVGVSASDAPIARHPPELCRSPPALILAPDIDSPFALASGRLILAWFFTPSPPQHH
ncbi:hypothetical protein FA95DRAFT_1560531 [Auriscalpium vulgare]|uniref:Uncharacterized protein n=1 Tax=Auriscalpium vulgare TaxID=40419 RepID=A0ACB8RPP8_9AGAM|nr:hypothetical protein FA95DRAFT_1560531 [Auriscalpium vulgare]